MLRLTRSVSAIYEDDPERVLTARTFEPLENERVWVAVRYVASARVSISKEWPGVLWEACLSVLRIRRGPHVSSDIGRGTQTLMGGGTRSGFAFLLEVV